MSQGVHLLVPFAACTAASRRQPLDAPELPHLAALLARLAPVAEDAGTRQDLSMPHERVLARAARLPVADGRIPLAAWHLRHRGEDPGTAAWAFVTPCHWSVARDHIRMHPPEALALTEVESQALLQAVQPYFEDDGLRLSYDAPTRWLACGEPLRDFACASLDRVSGGVVDAWLPRTPEARPLRRLQQEVQMLLYTHPVNEAREAQGLLPVNSFWLSGAGALTIGVDAGSPPLEMVHTLQAPALAGDGAAWAQAWRALDAGRLAALHQQLDQGAPVALTLCGDARARSWGPARSGAWRRLSHMLRAGDKPAEVLASL